MATADQVLKSIQKKVDRGLKNVGNLVLAEATQWVPINSGKLRASLTLQTDPAKGTVTLIAGKGIPWAKPQYFKPLRHLQEGGRPVAIRDRFPGTYSQAYRKALPSMRPLSKFDNAPRWFERSLQSKGMKGMIRETMVKSLNAK